MKFAPLLLIAFLLCTFIFVVNVSAEDHLIAISSGFSIIPENINEWSDIEFSPSFRALLCANLEYKYFIINYLSTEARVGISIDPYGLGEQMGEIGDQYFSWDAMLVPLTIGLNFEMARAYFIKPYIGAGIGTDYVNIKYEWYSSRDKEDALGSNKVETFNFSGYVTVGADGMISEHIGAGLYGNYKYSPAITFPMKDQYPDQDFSLNRFEFFMRLYYPF